VKPEDIVALRKELRCTPHELGEALGLSASVIRAWEQADQFPTKRYVEMMRELAAQGRGAVPRLRRARGGNATPIELLADPALWMLLRKLLTHQELREQVMKLAESYDEPG
jgi:transcriptional regulator with XRE-family HTH domain